MKKKKIIDIGVSVGKYDDFTEYITKISKKKKGGYVCIANVHMLVEAYDDQAFAAVVNNADMVTPDGMPLPVMMRFLYGIKQQRVAGMDLFPDLLRISEKEKLSVFFYGGTDDLRRKVIKKIEIEYPNLNVKGSIVPPFGKISDRLSEEYIAEINKADPNMIFIVLGCPKQEKFMGKISDRINGVMIGIGGAVPVFAGDINRAPKWMQRLSLEWMFRLFQEPERLWKRYLYTNSKFIFLSIREFYRRRILKKIDSV